MNARQAAAFALANGAELSIDGRTINPGRERFILDRAPVNRQPAPEPAPAPEPPRPSQSYATEAEVQAMLAARDESWSRQFQQLAIMIAQVSQARPDRASPPTWDFAVDYGPKGEISNIRAVPNA